MTTSREWEFAGTRGAITVRSWADGEPRYIAVLAHGYGEHLGRYDHVADVLVRHGAVVCGPDHMGHGRSAGDRVLIEDFEDVVADLHTTVEAALADHPGLPVVLIGHSMGGLIATRHAQLHGDVLAALVLSGPVLGRWHVAEQLLPLEEMPDEPIDTSTLSRDPAVGKAYTEDPLVWHGPFKKTTVRALDTALRRIDEHGSLGALPTFYVHGDADELVRPQDTRIGIETVRGDDLTERLYPDARHEVFNETNRDEVLADVTAFIDRVLS
ncbi:alpha/beta hydrolase [Actinomadura madurae]|uniref:alpha/beta hydrolase n=1 Tax=Actinomadura madurae TaxID=1993 RepID=UPI0020269629|nr:alpha/beta hydrolase [Actinomadura madurae]MCP9947879.1 alpha/beta hydrolase [Actinomadura madurae]MCP9964652.1 alpha/beta hydrolase [Actinomadura madurae]URM93547.1 alpha/beta hydrolase [Actinomadura madurae]URN04266.1 alpha/beta hydrolase [Actinomadura madurae]